MVGHVNLSHLAGHDHENHENMKKDVVGRTVDARGADDGEESRGPARWVHTVGPLHHHNRGAHGQAGGHGRLPMADQLWKGRKGGSGVCVDGYQLWAGRREG